MDVPFERRLEYDVLDVLFAVQNGLIEMRHRPTRGDVIVEKLGELIARGLGAVVSPGAEGHEKLVVLVEDHIAVHHGGEADRPDRGDLDAVLMFDRRRHVGVAVLEPRPNIFERIRPDAVFKTVLPRMAARGDGLVLFIDENGFDPRRPEFDAERGLAAFDRFSVVFHE